MPGALPEISPSPEYDPFVDFRDRAMFMQAWSSYGVQWPVINNFLGIRPDVPHRRLSVVADVPDSWPGLSVRRLQQQVGAEKDGVYGDETAARVKATVKKGDGKLVDLDDWMVLFGISTLDPK